MNAAEDATTYGQPGRLRVLLVEDDPADVALIEDTFATHTLDTELHHVSDGVEAMAFLRCQGQYADAPRPKLILLDLNMPRMNGREVLTAIKADPRLQTIPVVVFTTSAVDADVVASYTAHANAYVTKPIDLDEFESVVQQIHRFFGRIVTLPADSRAA
ncbi:response regulator [Micromonospora okii]|uniref:response regulator n=1 Tax=Micromonospora okii TaxID=1182970 RepID=UPI001E4CE3DB|nr:response regulator [Micromonospora okii]